MRRGSLQWVSHSMGPRASDENNGRFIETRGVRVGTSASGVEALSELFINGSAFEYDEPNDWLLRKMAESGYTIQELERILVEEVGRSCTGWLRHLRLRNRSP